MNATDINATFQDAPSTFSNDTSAHSPTHDVSQLSDAELHRRMLAPWVLAVLFQAVFMGIVCTQSYALLTQRSFLSWPRRVVVALVFWASLASYTAQIRVLWFFSMSSLGEVRDYITAFPPSLVIDLWLTPTLMGTCTFVQAYFAYTESGSKKRIWCIVLPLWLVQITSSFMTMWYTTLTFRGEPVNGDIWGHWSYCHLMSRLTAILAPAFIRLYLAYRLADPSCKNSVRFVNVLNTIFRSGILAVIPAATEAGVVLKEQRLSIAANIAYTCTPRFYACATLASLLAVAEQKEAEKQRRDEEERQERYWKPSFVRHTTTVPEEVGIELA